jgi:antitoxin (DNA-binding transcriptional repressor) of toxin-antitoxin stability system
MFVLNSNVKDAIAEQAIVLAATKLRIQVLRPVNEHGRIDLALDIAGALWRVQVKWGRLNAARDVVIVSLLTSRYTPRGHLRSTYTRGEVDLFAVYCGELDRCFLLPGPPLADRTVVYLRLTPARNGQRACINLADDFTFNGAVAQLARASRWQREGQGFESPQLHSPENPRDTSATVGAEKCRTQFGYWIERVCAGDDVLVTRRGKPMITLTAAAPTSTELERVKASVPRLGPIAASAPQPDTRAGPHLFPSTAAARPT